MNYNTIRQIVKDILALAFILYLIFGYIVWYCEVPCGKWMRNEHDAGCTFIWLPPGTSFKNVDVKDGQITYEIRQREPNEKVWFSEYRIHFCER